MTSPRVYPSLQQAELPPRPVFLAIGMFDGVHLGHQHVLDSAVRTARQQGGLAGVLTFWPHPSRLFTPDSPTRMIMPRDVKSRMLGRFGVDFVIEQPFTPDFARLEAEEFMPLLMGSLPSLAAIYVGENWRFGRGRRGDVPLLLREASAAGVSVISAAGVRHQGVPVSSTRIRQHLQAGEVEQANQLLGYAYFAEGTVEPGARMGSQLGFPTLNVNWEPELQPRFGVYAVQVSGNGSDRYPGVANYGVRPTVQSDGRPWLESHLLGACPFGAGDFVRVEWHHFLRPERKFESVDALRVQIEQDRVEAERLLAGDPLSSSPD